MSACHICPTQCGGESQSYDVQPPTYYNLAQPAVRRETETFWIVRETDTLVQQRTLSIVNHHNRQGGAMRNNDPRWLVGWLVVERSCPVPCTPIALEEGLFAPLFTAGSTHPLSRSRGTRNQPRRRTRVNNHPLWKTISRQSNALDDGTWNTQQTVGDPRWFRQLSPDR